MAFLLLLLPFLLFASPPISKEAFTVFVKDLSDSMAKFIAYEQIGGSPRPRMLLNLLLEDLHPDQRTVRARKILGEEGPNLYNAYNRSLIPKWETIKSNISTIGINLERTILDLFDQKVVGEKNTIEFIRNRTLTEVGLLQAYILSNLWDVTTSDSV